MSGKRVVVAPLDWGLGHATRCIPIIHSLLNRNCEVWIATSGSALDLLRKEFPSIKFVEIASYNTRYSKKLPLAFSVGLQIPKFLRAIREEHKQLEKFSKEHAIDLIISDNRYGCYVKNVRSIFITHQLNIQLPAWLWLLQPFVRYMNNSYVSRFSACWIPDNAGTNKLTGSLSESKSLPSQYVGILSRFQKPETSGAPFYEVAVILSGPEPHRTQVENKIIPQMMGLQMKSILVRGVVESQSIKKQEGNLTIVNYLTTDELQSTILRSKIIVARSGYSTIMDMAVLGKKVIFIPTPGQTEQEYLAIRLMNAGICYSINQKHFDLNLALQQSNDFKGFSNIEPQTDLLEKALDEALGL